MKSDIFIDALKYGKNKLTDKYSFTLDEIRSHLEKTNRPEYISFVLNELLNENFSRSNDNKYRLNSEGYFRLLNYENLEIANESLLLSNKSLELSNDSLKEAKKSYKIAIHSFWVAFIIGLCSIVLPIAIYLWDKREKHETIISKDQFDKLKTEDSDINASLNKLLIQDSTYHIKPAAQQTIKKPG